MREGTLVRHFALEDDSIYLPFAETSEIAIDRRDEGRNVELISGRLSGSRDLNVGIARLRAGEHHIAHKHPRGDEFYVFLCGQAAVSVDGVDHSARRGTAVYIPAGTTHAIRNVGGGPVDVLYGLNRPEYADLGLIYTADC